MTLRKRLEHLEMKQALPAHLAHLTGIPVQEWTDAELDAFMLDFKTKEPNAYAWITSLTDEELEALRDA
jgi:hypothetical protein